MFPKHRRVEIKKLLNKISNITEQNLKTMFTNWKLKE